MRRRALVAAAAAGVTAGPPDTSLATIPVGYYGAAWSRSAANIEMLSRQRVVVLMQEDGGCWVKCCPHRLPHTYAGVCQNNSEGMPIYNASEFAGCGPSCDQHGTQCAVFAAVKAAAGAAGRPPPHSLLYMNAVYDWPFDAAHAAGAEAIDVLDIDGVPHAEVCDPGIYPSYLLDYGRAAGRNAFLGAVRKYVVDGEADGVFLDNFAQVPLSCDKSAPPVCTAIRNRWASKANAPSVVTEAQVAAYKAGKNESLTAAARLISDAGGAFAAFTFGYAHPNPNGANTAVAKLRGGWTPADVIDAVRTARRNGYSYFLLLAHAFRSPDSNTTADPDMTGSQCSEFQLASFLLAVEEGCFLLCNGWSDDFARPLGAPDGPAVVVGGTMRRTFAHGAAVEWAINTTRATVTWPAAPREAPARRPEPAAPREGS